MRCSIAGALELIGDRWLMLLVRYDVTALLISAGHTKLSGRCFVDGPMLCRACTRAVATAYAITSAPP